MMITITISPKIVILGDPFIDRDVLVSTTRENPEVDCPVLMSAAGQRIWTIQESWEGPGGAALLAAILRRLRGTHGCDIRPVVRPVRPDDDIFLLAPYLVEDAPVKTRYWHVDTGAFLGRVDEPDFVYVPRHWQSEVEGYVDIINQADALIYCDYGRGACDRTVREWLASRLRSDLPIYSTARQWPETRAWWWVLNETEYEEIVCQWKVEELPWTEHQWVIETRGKEGSWVSQVRQGHPRYVQDVRVQIQQHTVQSVVGAGDAYLAALVQHGEDSGGVVAAQRFAERFVQMSRKDLRNWLADVDVLGARETNDEENERVEVPGQ